MPARLPEQASTNSDLGESLIEACSRLELATAERLLKQGASPGYKAGESSHWSSPMDAALAAAEKAFYRDLPTDKTGELIKMLLLAGASPSECFPDHEGASVCMRLAGLGLDSELALCCGLGADLRARDATGDCALSWAASHYLPQCLNLLLGLGMDPAEPHCLATGAAIAADRQENLAILLASGASVDVESSFELGRHELFRRALEFNRPGILALLLEKGADPTFGGRCPEAFETALAEFKSTEAGDVLARVVGMRKAAQEALEIDLAMAKASVIDSAPSGPRL
jgi:ankyrin repeat protein